MQPFENIRFSHYFLVNFFDVPHEMKSEVLGMHAIGVLGMN